VLAAALVCPVPSCFKLQVLSLVRCVGGFGAASVSSVCSLSSSLLVAVIGLLVCSSVYLFLVFGCFALWGASVS